MQVDQDAPGGSPEENRPQPEGAVQVADDTGPEAVRVIAIDARIERRLVMRRLLSRCFVDCARLRMS